MGTLAQAVAVLKGKRTNIDKNRTALYHQLQISALWTGFRKSYDKLIDSAPELQPEEKNVQANVIDELQKFKDNVVPMLDLAVEIDDANQDTGEDIIVNGKPVCLQLSVPSINLLVKQFEDFHTYLGKLPSLDTAKDWTAAGKIYEGPAQTKIHTTKVTEYITTVAPTKEHPAQVAQQSRDVPQYRSNSRDFSGGIPIELRDELQQRCIAVLDALKMARAQANTTKTTPRPVVGQIFDYILAPIAK